MFTTSVINFNHKKITLAKNDIIGSKNFGSHGVHWIMFL